MCHHYALEFLIYLNMYAFSPRKRKKVVLFYMFSTSVYIDVMLGNNHHDEVARSLCECNSGGVYALNNGWVVWSIDVISFSVKIRSFHPRVP